LFIEWTAGEIDIDSAAFVGDDANSTGDGQWQSLWRCGSTNQMADQAQVWSKRVLKLSKFYLEGCLQGSSNFPVTCFDLLPSVCTSAMPLNSQ